MKKYALFLIAFIAFGSCKSKTTVSDEKDKDAKLKELLEKSSNLNKGDGTYDLTAPEGWEKKTTQKGGVNSIVLLAPIENPKDDFKENINVVTEKIPSSVDLKTYTNVSSENLEKYLTKYLEVANTSTTINGMPANLIQYKHEINGFKLDVLAYILIKNDMAYILTCSAKDGTISKHKANFEKAVNSFVIN